MIDLERFKNINDSLGRPAGDLLLKQVAAWLTQVVGDVNLLARLDADHFGVVLPNLKHARDARRLLKRTMAAFLSHPFQLNDAEFRIAAKVGVAICPDDGADADTLFKNAESALKKAKLSGDKYLSYAQNMTVLVLRGRFVIGESAQAGAGKSGVRALLPAENESEQGGKIIGARVNVAALE